MRKYPLFMHQLSVKALCQLKCVSCWSHHIFGQRLFNNARVGDLKQQPDASLRLFHCLPVLLQLLSGQIGAIAGFICTFKSN